VIEEENFTLSQNYPNPAINVTEISYTLSEISTVSFDVFDITGKSVYSINKGLQSTGRYNLNLNVADFESGIYYYSMQAGDQKITRKMVIMN